MATGLQAKLDFAVDPLQEAVAYETLMALEDGSEAVLEKEFPSKSGQLSLEAHKPLTKILEIKRDHGSMAEIQALYPKVESYINNLRDDFSICTQDYFHYQARLRDAKTPLRLFYYKGDINLLETACVSVVGSRQASPEGLERAARLTKALIEAGYTIVSGLAKGIDTVALQTAVGIADGRAVAVIGTPINQYYPKDNAKLQDKIAQDHLLISHVPFYRYDHQPFSSRRFYFPKRNITMSAISQATVIVEASETSGSLSQAEAALRQDRQLFICQQIFETHNWPNRFTERGAIKFNNPAQLITELAKAQQAV